MISARRVLRRGTPAAAALLCLLAGLMFASCGRDTTPPAAADPRDAATLVLYTSLPDERAANLADAYRGASGVIVNVMTESDEVLIEKLIRKEHYPGADVLLISGAGHLAQAVDSDVLRPITSSALKALPKAYREPDGFWFGAGVRAELIVYDREAVDAATLGGYASLADERWSGRLCLQRGVRERSRSLVAALIAELGEREAELVVRGWRANLVTSVYDTERELLLAIESGDCAVGIAGSDAVARFHAEGLNDKLGFRFPTSSQGGTHISITAAGVARHANDAALATRFVEWLASPQGQTALHEGSFDYPVLADVSLTTPLNSWPAYSASPISPARIGYLYPDAILLVERARYR